MYNHINRALVDKAMFFEGVDVQRFQSAVRKWYNQLHPTCRRSASPRATGLGTGTAGGVGAPPSPVRPWLSSSDSRNRKKNPKVHLHTEEVDPQKPTPLLFRVLFKSEINIERIDASHGMIFDFSPKQGRK